MPSSGDLPNPRIETQVSHIAGGLTAEPQGKPKNTGLSLAGLGPARPPASALVRPDAHGRHLAVGVAGAPAAEEEPRELRPRLPGAALEAAGGGG